MSTNKLRFLFTCVAIAMIGTHGHARAQSSKCEERPWDDGVTKEDQERAKSLYREGNQFYDESLFARAADRYLAAIQLWAHPRFHHNLMLAYINVGGEPVAAYESLLFVLECGGKFLSQEKMRAAEGYRKLLEPQVAALQVVTEQPGTRVTLDGKQILVGPGREHRLVKAGGYQLEARNKKFLTATESLRLNGGELTTVRVALVASDTIPVRRWARWKPWAVLGASLGAAAVGGLVHWGASSDVTDFRNSFALFCPEGCAPADYPQGLKDKERRATWKSRAAIATYSVAGAAALVGAALVYLNRVRRRPDPAAEKALEMDLAPLVGSNLAGLSIGRQF